MQTAILKAHYDGKQIVLDEPFELSRDAPLVVTVLAPEGDDAVWTATNMQSLVRAYDDNEPDYTAADLKPQ